MYGVVRCNIIWDYPDMEGEGVLGCEVWFKHQDLMKVEQIAWFRGRVGIKEEWN